MLSQSYGIFADPVFIRRNTLLNLLHSHFPSGELIQKHITTFTDQLRAFYHNLSLENDQKERIDALSLILSILTLHSEILNDLDWYYCERISIHFANFSLPVPN